MAFFLTKFFFLLLLLPFFVVIAQRNGTIRVGGSLTAGDDNALWLSPSEDFAFGYQPLGNDHFLLTIWYYKLRQDHIVWYANEENPAPRKSKLELTPDQGLVLTDPQGNKELWRSDLVPNPAQVAYGVMNDTGNFVLVAENSETIWESFSNPKDTLLPTQIIGIGGQLCSRNSPNDFSLGRFQFRMLSDGSAVLNTVNLPTREAYDTYYFTGTRDDKNKSNSGHQVVYDKLGYLYLLKKSGDVFYISSPKDVVAFPASEYYHKATLNFDGVLTLSCHLKSSSSANATWNQIKAIPNDICVAVHGNLGTGPCGHNSICTLNEDQRPSCKCPIGYSILDPTDEYSGCKPEFLPSCNGASSGDHFEFRPLPNTDWPTSDYELFKPYSVEDCKKSCLQDCLCAVVVYNYEEDSCWKKKLPLSNGREVRTLSTTVFFKFSNDSRSGNKPDLSGSNKEEEDHTLVIVISVLLGSSVFVNFLLVSVMCLAFFFYSKRKYFVYPNESHVKSNLRHFTYKELVEATNGFKEELGRGSCGVVYKGETDQSSPIAVKILDRMFQDNDKEFQAEVNVIGQTHHKNLVRLIGYCDEQQHRLLVYEFMRNGTLASFLFGGLRPSWYQRVQIAFGIARGLVYLHEECSTQIIHCDIKPQNVLLDDYYNARISDFGLAKLLALNQSHTKTNIRGTKGYVAPDWFRSAPISVKVDVYSFGVLLLEIICRRRNVLDMNDNEEEKVILTDWAYDCYVDGRLEKLVENDMEVMSEITMVERFVMVAIWCLQEDPSVRPTMKKVMLMLEGIVQVSAPPTPCLSSSVIN